MLDMLINALEFAIYMLYEKLVELVTAFWDETFLALNHGQQVIYSNHIDETVHVWLGEAGDNWPDADADAYAEQIFMSYDAEVMDRAFSDSIYAPVDKMWEIIYKAQQLNELKQVLEAMNFGMGGGGGRGPRNFGGF
jgi:hypothetical protein